MRVKLSTRHQPRRSRLNPLHFHYLVAKLSKMYNLSENTGLCKKSITSYSNTSLNIILVLSSSCSVGPKGSTGRVALKRITDHLQEERRQKNSSNITLDLLKESTESMSLFFSKSYSEVTTEKRWKLTALPQDNLALTGTVSIRLEIEASEQSQCKDSSSD